MDSFFSLFYAFILFFSSTLHLAQSTAVTDPGKCMVVILYLNSQAWKILFSNHFPRKQSHLSKKDSFFFQLFHFSTCLYYFLLPLTERNLAQTTAVTDPGKCMGVILFLTSQGIILAVCHINVEGKFGVCTHKYGKAVLCLCLQFNCYGRIS